MRFALLLVVGTVSAQVSPVYKAHEILLSAKLAGGIVYVGEEGLANAMPIPEGMDVRDALTSALAGQSKYIWRENCRAIEIVPKQGLPELLNTNIELFEWRSDESAMSAVGRLERWPEVLRRMSQLGYVEGLHSLICPQKPPRVGAPPEPVENPQLFTRRNITFFDLLNEIAKSYPVPAIWRYEESARGTARVVTISAR